MPHTLINRYRDLNLSFVANPVRKDIGTLSDSDAVKQAVVNLVMTKHYERPFHPEIGCNVTAMLFENITSVTALSIQRSIQDVIQNFESQRVKLQSVTVVPSYAEDGYNVNVTFYVLNVRDLISVGFFLTRLR